MTRPSNHLQVCRKQVEVLNMFKLNEKKGEQAMEKAQQSKVQKARSDAAKARELMKQYQKMLGTVSRQIKRARVSQQFMKDERKGLRAIVSELRREMEHTTQTSELASPTEIKAVELQSKVEGLEGELRELKGRLHTSEVFAQRLTERSRRSEVRVRELTRQRKATRERL